jgi:transposase-like protein
MRLQLILPRVEPTEMMLPTVCPYEGCQGVHVRHHQELVKRLNDTVYEVVLVHRYRCLRCERTFRVYPQGVTNAQTSQRVKRLAVLLYLLGLDSLHASGAWLRSGDSSRIQTGDHQVMSLNPNAYADDRRATRFRVTLRSWVPESPAHCNRVRTDYTGKFPLVKRMATAGDCYGVHFGVRSCPSMCLS